MKFKCLAQWSRDIVIDGEGVKLEYGKRIKESVGPEGIRFLRESNIEGIYGYGLEQTEDNWEHKAGYIWSSRAGVINKTFGTKLIEVVYCETSYSPRTVAMDIDVLAELLEGSDYEVDPDPREDETDIRYYVRQKKVDTV